LVVPQFWHTGLDEALFGRLSFEVLLGFMVGWSPVGAAPAPLPFSLEAPLSGAAPEELLPLGVVEVVGETTAVADCSLDSEITATLTPASFMLVFKPRAIYDLAPAVFLR
jgi:hypothetical protein